MPETVQNLMAPAVVTLRPEATIEAARALMHAHGVHALPVVDPHEQPIGLLTSADLASDLPAVLPVSRVMTRDVVEIGKETAPEAAAGAMIERHIHHLLVTENGRLVGILSALDLLKLVRGKPRARTKRK